jgi:hypothetical protein
MAIEVPLVFTRWQWRWLEREGKKRNLVVEKWIKDAFSDPQPKPEVQPSPPPRPEIGDCLWEQVLEPHSAIALKLSAGQVLRVSQTTGGQCADLNFFARDEKLTPYSAGLTRNFAGAYPRTGAELLSDFPHPRVLMRLIHDTVEANDVLFPRCCAPVYERFYGESDHPSCHDLQSRLRLACGLNELVVHDTFNLFMATAVRPDGRLAIEPSRAHPGDFADLRAETDVCILLDVCADDLSPVNLWWQSPLHLSLWNGSAPSDADWSILGEVQPEGPIWETRLISLAEAHMPHLEAGPEKGTFKPPRWLRERLFHSARE